MVLRFPCTKNFTNMRVKQTAKSDAVIKRRVKRYLSAATTYAPEVSSALEVLRPLGEVAIFGGLLRNAALLGLDNFRSDIDIVIALEKETDFATVLRAFNPLRTRFGGYRLRANGVQLDVWPLSSTWAISQGLVQGQSLRDLIKTTFFNWDAIVYLLDSGLLYHRESYLEEIREHFLDVVLLENPNPIGMAQRAFKLMREASANLSPTLVQFLINTAAETARVGNSEYLPNESQLNFYNEFRRTVFVLKQHFLEKPGEPFRMESELRFG